MKNKHLLSVLLIVITVAFGLVACEKDTVNSEDEQSLITGKWDVNGYDEVSFNEDGSIVWTRDGIYTFTGSYALYKKCLTICLHECYFMGTATGTVKELTENKMIIWLNSSYGYDYSDGNYYVMDCTRISH